MKQISGEVNIISSKSDVHRLILAAALSFGDTTKILYSGLSEDISASIRCAEAIGAKVEVTGSEIKIKAELNKRVISFDFGESGTTARLFIPVAAALFVTAQYTGSGRLPDRPFTQLFTALSENGAHFSSQKLPATHFGMLKSGTFAIEGNISSQFISGLLFALPLLDGDSEIKLLSKLESAAYVEMTLNTLRRFGIRVRKTADGFFVPGGQRYRPEQSIITADSDWSNAAFWLAAGAASEKGVIVNGLNLESSQGDKAIVDLLGEFGAKVSFEYTVGDTLARVKVSKSELRGIAIDATDVPDLVPILAVVGAVSSGMTVIKNAARLRLKESDRLATVSRLINNIGGNAEETEDGLRIYGKERLTGGVVDGAGDHRIVMSAAVASLSCENEVVINGRDAVNKSYPSFFDEFDRLVVE